MQPILESCLSNIRKPFTIISGQTSNKGQALDHTHENLQSFVSYTISTVGAAYSVKANDVSDWAQAIGLVVMLLVGIVRLAYDMTRYYRYLKSKKDE